VYVTVCWTRLLRGLSMHAGLNVAGFVLWNVQPGFMFRNAFLSLRNLKEGRVHVLITSAFSQACCYAVTHCVSRHVDDQAD